MRTTAFFMLGLLLLPFLAGVVAAEESEELARIGVEAARADRLDLDNDGDYDQIHVVAMINASNDAAINIEVVAEHSTMGLSFWDNVTVPAGELHTVDVEVEAWSNGEYSIWLRIHDAGSGTVLHDAHIATHALDARLTAPTLSMDLESEEIIFTGDSCLIHRDFSDLVGERYDAMGTVSISGVPWSVGANETTVDCSNWPAGEYTITEHYRNRLNMAASAELNFQIHVHPAPSFEFVTAGMATEAGTPCSIEINATGETLLAENDVEWMMVAPDQTVDYQADAFLLDCTMYAPGVHKIRTTLTSPQGRETTHAINIVRMPPAVDASQAVLDASGDADRWPSVSEGEEYAPSPLLLNLGVSAALVGVSGMLVAIILGIAVGILLTRESEGEEADWGLAAAPDPEGLPSYVDPDGIHWRQQPDGSVDWYDASRGVWSRFEG